MTDRVFKIDITLPSGKKLPTVYTDPHALEASDTKTVGYEIARIIVELMEQNR